MTSLSPVAKSSRRVGAAERRREGDEDEKEKAR